MTQLARYRLLALVFMLVVSNLALVGHVTAHFQPQWAECELCVNQAQPLAALPAAEPHFEAAVPRADIRADASQPSLRSTDFHPSQPRAPPAQSS